MSGINKSLDEFFQAADAVQALIELEQLYDDPPPQQQRDAVRGLRGGIAVLLVAAFEEFLRSSVLYHMSSLNSAPIHGELNNLPPKLSTTAIHNSMTAALKGPRFKKTTKLDRVPGIIKAASNVSNGKFDPSSVLRHGNPNSAGLKKYFKELGLYFPQSLSKDFFLLWGRPESSTFVSDKLDEVVNRRNRIAHTSDALSESRTNLIESHKFMLTLAISIDNYLEQYVQWIYSNPGVNRNY